MRHQALISERGAALLVAMNVIIILSAMAAAFLVVAYADNREHLSTDASMRAFYVAEAGLNDAIAQVRAGGDGVLGSPQAPISFGNGSYHVLAGTDGNQVTLVSVARVGGVVRAVEGVLSLAAEAPCQEAAFGDESVLIEGSNIIDSYDSSQGTYLSQETNSDGGRSYAGSGGDVASDGDIDVTDPSALVAGDVSSTDPAKVTVAGALILGTTAPKGGSRNLPAIQVPTVPGAPTPLVHVTGTNVVRPIGKYRLSQLQVSNGSTLTLTGPATYVIDSVDLQSGQIVVNAAAGPVYMYVLGDFQIQNTAAIYSNRKQATDVMVFLDIDNLTGYESTKAGDGTKPMSVRDNGLVNGVLYAPNGVVNLDGDSHVYGSVSAKRVRMDGNASIHFDEALRAAPWLGVGSGLAQTWNRLQRDYEQSGSGSADLVAWREVHASTVPEAGDGPPGPPSPPGPPNPPGPPPGR